ncbi:MAG: hypothetical protein ACXVIG_05230 [Halobacteriota archaeon]
MGGHRIVETQRLKGLEAAMTLERPLLNPMYHRFDADMLIKLSCHDHTMPCKQGSVSWHRVYVIEEEGVTIA